MTDKELLEAAAKAAGMVTMPEHFHPDAGVYVIDPIEGGHYWSSLADDGASLRLANAKQLDIRHANGKVHAGLEGEFWCTERWFPNGDKNAATRRAITRAAAALRGDAGGGR